MTPYDDIYERFQGKIEDYDLLSSTDPTVYDDTMLGFLKSSIPKFTNCTQDLSNRDDTLKQFNIDLSDLEQEILATLMIGEYLSPKVLRSELLEQRLGSKDFQNWSPGNQIKSVKDLRDAYKNEANDLMNQYYYKGIM